MKKPAAPRRSTPALEAGSRVTLRVLADHLGLSPASVSLTLNRAPGAAAIPAATQDRIRAAAERLHYRPNSIARSLRHRRSLTIGVMVPEISDGYASLVMSGIEDQLLQDGYLYFVASHRHRRDLIEEYPKLMLARAVDGLIAVDTPCERPLPVPVVSVSGHRHTAGVTNIILNHERAARLALGHLESLGHQRFAFIRGQAFSSDSPVRWRATRDAMRALGLPIDRTLVTQLEGDAPSPRLGEEATRRLIGAGARFTALFAFNDVAALGAIRALREHGLRVPEDVSVVGFDDIPSAAYQNPGLTTVRQPLREMGRRAAETLVHRVEGRGGKASPQTISLDPELVVRGTTGAVRRGSA
jgi:DNA-binding LacI/PurR family transcriptional regulator